MPERPQLARIFPKESQPNFSLMKGSSENVQPAATEGNVPQRLFSPKVELPSRRKLNESKYRSLKLYSNRAK